jgi:two-component system, cell cycle response regulator
MAETFRIVLVGSDHTGARLVREALAGADAHWGQFDLEVVDRLPAGVQRLAKGDVAAVLLDLSRPEAGGLDAASSLREEAPETPLIVLTPASGGALGVEAVHAGARDYLQKDQIGGSLLARALWYAIDRRRLEASLHQMTLIDDISGLYNRRGFFKFGDQQLKLIRRMGKRALVLEVDIQTLREINETFGHAAGDIAIADAAALLKRTFRESDIVGRLGGDKFAVLAIGVADDGPRSILRRLAKTLAGYNEVPDRRFRLSFSLGFAPVDLGDGSSLDHLLAEADRDLYGKKNRRTRPGAAITL